MVRIRSHSIPSVYQLRGEMDRLMSALWSNESAEALAPAAGFPAINLWEEDARYIAEAELPGVDADSFEISVLGRDVSIKGIRQSATVGETVADQADEKPLPKWFARERREGEFERKFRLPAEIDVNQVDAKLVDGVLTLTMPKAAAALPRQIKISGAGDSQV